MHLLPFGVIEYFGYVEVPLVVAISASFLLIEKMAIHLQDPFENKPTDTPMTAIAVSIEKNLMQLYTKSTADKKYNKKLPVTDAVVSPPANSKTADEPEYAEVASAYASNKEYFIL